MAYMPVEATMPRRENYLVGSIRQLFTRGVHAFVQTLHVCSLRYYVYVRKKGIEIHTHGESDRQRLMHCS